ncbi:uncharacterized protein LOC113295613 [Papaver somniferum]|uniref:uncharacterized protein LOC113295613 n=1 Tax=Papaver somniferum TaxID=3469 RepID=UPI000E6F628E|nr:uncharacterized protein LOC113295613 [Papaver somniferum]
MALSYMIKQAQEQGLISGFQVVEGGKLVSHLQFADDTLIFLDANLIQGIKVTTSCPAISHLFFTDDCLIFTHVNPDQVSNLNSIIENFSKISGQAINFDKSGLAFSPKTSSQSINAITNTLNIKRLGLQDKYLGVPLLLQRNKTESFSGLTGGFEIRLGNWRSKHLNLPARTVLGSLATHQMSVFPMPKKLKDRMDTIQKRFLWNKASNSRGVTLIPWTTIAGPKCKGGLNIRQTDIFNKALLTKLAWRMLNEPDSLCFIILKHMSNVSWLWRAICKGLEVIKNYYCWEISNGKSINIWKDVWVPSLGVKVNSRFSSLGMVKVEQLIDSYTKSWNMNIVNALFSPDIVQEIAKIRIPMIGKDQIRWTRSRNDGSTPSGIGLMLRSCTGKFEGAKEERIQVVDEKQEEFVAALESIKWAMEQGIKNLILEGDNKNVVNAINGNMNYINWTTNSVVQECLFLLKSFENWSCSFVKRDANSIADTLAKHVRANGNGLWYLVPPDFLHGDLRKDLSM